MERTPSTLLTLPADPLRLIAENLFRLTEENLARISGRDLINLCLTNRRLNEVLCGNPNFWRYLYYRGLSDTPPTDRDFRKAYLNFYLKTREESIGKLLYKDYTRKKLNIEILKIGTQLDYEKIVLRILDELRKLDPNNIVDYYNEVMMAASEGGGREIVQLMLEYGATDYNRTMAGAAAGGHREILKLMMELGANDYNRTLAMAAKGGHREIVDLMLELGATSYNLPLIAGAIGGHLEIVKLMLERGANKYNLAMEKAAREGYSEIVDYIRRWTTPETH